MSLFALWIFNKKCLFGLKGEDIVAEIIYRDKDCHSSHLLASLSPKVNYVISTEILHPKSVLSTLHTRKFFRYTRATTI